MDLTCRNFLPSLPAAAGSGRKWQEVAGSGKAAMGDLAVAVAVAGNGRKEVEGRGRKWQRAWAAGSKSSQVHLMLNLNSGKIGGVHNLINPKNG